uniref:Uncharacterized protein n=1 Tax=Amphimedon queenslandica TaxID=400682 RepID=A0A1X7VLF4_AMPQE
MLIGRGIIQGAHVDEKDVFLQVQEASKLFPVRQGIEPIIKLRRPERSVYSIRPRTRCIPPPGLPHERAKRLCAIALNTRQFMS